MTATPGGDWRRRVASAEDAIGEIHPGDHVFVGSACATPRALLEALESRPKPLDGVVLVHSLTDRVGIGDPPTTRYRHRVFYVGSDVHALLPTGLVEYVPVSLPEVPGLVRSGRIRIDVALVQVAPPDDDGTCSLGISVDVTQAAALSARTVLAEVNEAMPRTTLNFCPSRITGEPGASSQPAKRLPIITVLAPAANALTRSPEVLMPPSAITGIGMPAACRPATLSMIAVSCGTPKPVTIRVVQIDPGPMPTLMASAPASANSRAPSAVATLPAMICACEK